MKLYYIKESQINNIIEVIEEIRTLLKGFVIEFMDLKEKQEVPI